MWPQNIRVSWLFPGPSSFASSPASTPDHRLPNSAQLSSIQFNSTTIPPRNLAGARHANLFAVVCPVWRRVGSHVRLLLSLLLFVMRPAACLWLACGPPVGLVLALAERALAPREGRLQSHCSSRRHVMRMMLMSSQIVSLSSPGQFYRCPFGVGVRPGESLHEQRFQAGGGRFCNVAANNNDEDEDEDDKGLQTRAKRTATCRD